jgi:hypothetical protein
MRNCAHCEQEIEKYPHIYIGMWKDYRSNSVVYYHVDCFKEVAGEEYIDQLMAAKTVPDIDDVVED